MRTIAKLFGRSPFAPLQAHMGKVAACVKIIGELFEALQAEDQITIEKLSERVSELEHAADLSKNDIRNNLPKGLFLPVDKASLLEILKIQDRIADCSEDVGYLLGLRKLRMPKNIKDDFEVFLTKNLESFSVAQKMIRQMDELLESSFGGFEAERVKKMVDEVAYKEHEADVLQKKLLKNLFGREKDILYTDFILWLRIIEKISNISDLSENLGDRVRTMLDIK